MLNLENLLGSSFLRRSLNGLVYVRKSELSISDFIDAKPIDLVMRFVKQREWFLHRNNINELIADVPGRWGQHQLHIE